MSGGLCSISQFKNWPLVFDFSTDYSKDSRPVVGKNSANIALSTINVPKPAMGMTQFASIRNPSSRLPERAPARPTVSAKAVAITLNLVGNRSTKTQYIALSPRLAIDSKKQLKTKFCSDVNVKFIRITLDPAMTKLKTRQEKTELGFVALSKMASPLLWTTYTEKIWRQVCGRTPAAICLRGCRPCRWSSCGQRCSRWQARCNVSLCEIKGKSNMENGTMENESSGGLTNIKVCWATWTDDTSQTETVALGLLFSNFSNRLKISGNQSISV